MRYKLITISGDISYKDKMSLEEMQSFVGGPIQFYKNIICNEEGRLQNLPHNTIDNFFVGNIIIKERKKKSRPITQEIRDDHCNGDSDG